MLGKAICQGVAHIPASSSCKCKDLGHFWAKSQCSLGSGQPWKAISLLEQFALLFTKVLTPLSSGFFSYDTTYCTCRHPSRPTCVSLLRKGNGELAQACPLLFAALYK